MKRYIFKVTLLSDIILRTNSSTEGMQTINEFIPGSNFLGIVAKNYKKYQERSLAYDLFHSGKVCFGDAHISQNNQKSFKAPLSWFVKKGFSINSDKWVHHKINPEIRKSIKDQLKQVRNGWICAENEGNKLLSIRSKFVIKSAYDRVRRTSKDGQLFGMRYLESGSEWIFYLDIDESIDYSEIISDLTGEQYIGKSRSAQYGRIKIEQIEKKQKDLSTTELYRENENEYLIIYAESRLSFIDKYGQPTLQPNADNFGLNHQEWELDWGKSQVRHEIFAPYIFVNRSFLADRVCFSKGSVFVFRKLDPHAKYNFHDLLSGIGEYKNEGFGNVFLNPIFLKTDAQAKSLFPIIKEKINPYSINSIKLNDSTDIAILAWANAIEETEKKEHEIYKKVVRFCENMEKNHYNRMSKPTASQWGQIRSIAERTSTYNQLKAYLFEDAIASSDDGVIRSTDRAESGFLKHGKSEKTWRRIVDIFEKELEENKDYGTEYAVRLATQMQKIAQRKRSSI